MTTDALDDDTAAPVRRPASAGLIDGDTLALPRRADRAAQAAASPARPTARPAASAPDDTPRHAATTRLRLPNGTIVSVDRTIVLGRNPRAARIPLDPPPAFITLSSPSREVSASHLAIEAAGESIVVTDLHSANGSTMLLPNGTSRALVAGDSAVVPVGTILILGDGNAVTVLGAARAEPVAVGEIGSTA